MRLLIWLLLGYIVYKMLAGRRQSNELPDSSRRVEEETFRDPVCGVYVSAVDAVIGRVEGERIHFCSMACLEKYRESLEHK